MWNRQQGSSGHDHQCPRIQSQGALACDLLRGGAIMSCQSVMGEMTGEIWERFGMDKKHLSHTISPLYKGVSKDSGRDEPKTSQHVSESFKRTGFAIPA